MSKRTAGPAALLLTAIATCLACSGGGDEPPNVLVLVLDGCRPDRLGSYGFDRPTSPMIDRIAEDADSVVFERHYVQADWTKPSTASLFTGLFLYQHRVAIGPEPIDTPYWSQVLSDGFYTLPEAFRDGGYRTFSSVRIPHLIPQYGFTQGFDDFGFYADDVTAIREAQTLMASPEGRFFGYVHLVGCHHPYPASERDPEYMERFAFDYDEPARVADGVDFSSPGLAQEIGDTVHPTPEDTRFLELVYEARLRRTDRTVVGPLIEHMKQQGYYDDTLIVVTADHGHELMEHGALSHGHALWEEVIHVPMIVKFPGGRRPESLGARFGGISRSIDLYPSLLAAAGIASPTKLPGKNVFAGESVEFALAERWSDEADVDWALIRSDDKAIRTVDQSTRWFDLASDPGEMHDLAGDHAGSVENAMREIKALRRRHPISRVTLDTSAGELTEEQLEALRSLGYIQ